MSRKTGWLLSAVLVLCTAVFAVYLIAGLRQDSSAPEITIQTEELPVSVTADRAALLEGVTAWDARDGDVTASLVVERVSGITEGNRATVTYAAFDRAGNVAKAQRTLQFTDYQSPRFTLSQPLVFQSGRSVDVLACVGASDALDGALDSSIKASLAGGEGDLSEVGLHDVRFRVTNSMGETVYLTATVEVCPAGLYNAEIELRENIIYLPKGAAFAAEDYLVRMTGGQQEIALDPVDSVYDTQVQIASNVNTQVPGCYSVAYTVTNGALAGHTRLVVVVEE